MRSKAHLGILRAAGHRLSLLLVLLVAGCDGDPLAQIAPELPPPPSRAVPHEDRALFLEAARTAWAYADHHYRPATGLIDPVHNYSVLTVWDIASSLAALYCANRLGMLSDTEYDKRIRRALRTLREMELFQGRVFNRHYSTVDGRSVNTDGEGPRSEDGTGWSATDLGRLLVWLKIIAENQPRYAGEVQQVVRRIDFGLIVEDGYLWGAERPLGGETRRYPEGRVGYEQYAAYGFVLWGHRAERALRLHENTLPITVLGVPLVADRRGFDLLTSEPFVLTGLELGWNRDMRELAARVLQVQEERHRRTGQVTIVSEDGVPEPPHYFYYYVINFHGVPFTVLPADSYEAVDSPRWVSAKAAFGWHALLPGSYTRLAVATVAEAGGPLGWSAGVYEGTGNSTGGENLNTAAVVLEAALFSMTGRPLIHRR